MSLSVASLRQVQHINLTNGGFAHFAVTWRSRSRTADVSCLFKQPWCHDGFNHQASLTCIVTLVRSRVQDYCFDDTRNSSNYTLCCYLYKTGGAFSLLKSFFPWTSLCCETETDAACARICVFLLFIYSSFWLISYLIYTTNRNFSAFLPCMITHLLNLRISLAGLKGQTTNNGDTSDHFSQSINRFLWRVGSKLCPGFIWVSLNSNQELCIYLLFNYIFIFFYLTPVTSPLTDHPQYHSLSISFACFLYDCDQDDSRKRWQRVGGNKNPRCLLPYLSIHWCVIYFQKICCTGAMQFLFIYLLLFAWLDVKWWEMRTFVRNLIFVRLILNKTLETSPSRHLRRP